METFLETFLELLVALLLRDAIHAFMKSYRLGKTDVPGKFWGRFFEQL